MVRRRLRTFRPAWAQGVSRTVRAARTPRRLRAYLRARDAYSSMPGAEPLRWRDEFPQVDDATDTVPLDPGYFHQGIWAARRVSELRPGRHVDVASQVDLVGFLTTVTEVVHIDIRPLTAEVEGLTCLSGSVLDLPFANQALKSVSCLHVAEHIGLGRYGDPLDPLGTVKAARELQRVLAPGGQLLFSLPVGRSRVCFNAHRVHDPRTVEKLFGELTLLEFSAVDDAGRFAAHDVPEHLADSTYAVGLYRFVRAGS